MPKWRNLPYALRMEYIGINTRYHFHLTDFSQWELI
jgi:hypothetical protein